MPRLSFAMLLTGWMLGLGAGLGVAAWVDRTTSAPPLPTPAFGRRVERAPRPPVAEPALDPALLQALDAALAERDEQIRIRVVTPAQCGPTVAPGSDCRVGR